MHKFYTYLYQFRFICIAICIIGGLLLFRWYNHSSKISKIETHTVASGNTYKSTKIGFQVWMAENLHEKVFRNGDSILYAPSKESWLNAFRTKTPAWCYSNNTVGSQTILYNWFAVADARHLAPEGWVIPTTGDWNTLHDFVGKDIAGKKLKSTTKWASESVGIDSYGFTALPIGYRDSETADFMWGSRYAMWWASNQPTSYYVWFYTHCLEEKQFSPGMGFSVRCIRVRE